MDVFAQMKGQVEAALGRLVQAGRMPEGLDLGPVAVEPPRDAAHGDMATNAAMVLSRPARMAPRDIAEMLGAELMASPGVVSAEVAGPGFLNLRLDPSVWRAVLPAVLTAGTGFGRSRLGAGRKVNLEFVSANPTGPMHVGHARGAVFGGAAGFRRLRGHAGILRQRRRRPGRRAGPLGL
jgi:arginyl-tRNA synthetase